MDRKIMLRILITGANRGLGFEFLRLYLARGEHVFAGVRPTANTETLESLTIAPPGQLTLLNMDVTDEDAINDAVSSIKSLAGGLDLLINNAGRLTRGETPTNVKAETMLSEYHVNTVAPMIVAQKCLGLLRAGQQPKIINMASMVGSPGSKDDGSIYSYHASKVALHLLTRALAFDLKPEGILVAAIFPGWARTEMSEGEGSLSPPESAVGVVRVIDGLVEADAGGCYTWAGEVHPW
jgi:NAD(P)-dependent dehydrogenase (short-subunit alcohol dehydrogenase family)